MNFGPLVPQEIEPMVAFLEENNIPFEIHFNQEEAKKELEPSPGNNILYSELRTKSSLAQHFYVEVPDDFLTQNPKAEAQILRFITKDHFEDEVRSEEDNLINIDDEKVMQQKAEKTKWIQKIFAILFLPSILYGIITSLKK